MVGVAIERLTAGPASGVWLAVALPWPPSPLAAAGNLDQSASLHVTFKSQPVDRLVVPESK